MTTKPPHAKTIARVSRPSYRDFARRFLRPSVPCLITDYATQWRAARRWDVDTIGAAIGDRRIAPVKMDRGNFHIDLTQGVAVEPMGYDAYLDAVADTDEPGYYLRLALEGEFADLLADDYEVPEYCRRRLVLKKNLWIGARGASSDLHYDMTHNVVAQIRGRRRVVLFAPSDTPNLYPYPLRTLSWHHSQVRVEAPDHERFPRLRDAQPYETFIEAGEMLFIPQGWWHRFETLEPAIALNFFWLTPRLLPRAAASRAIWVAQGLRT
ncbi:MAG: cupin-like domain-containing protein [Myxococcales bacterium]|nr:cupin-like domain-containing protein [Myxococcales bacterium]MCB9521381.1 cupin-like domain-containing protein [Myxococcales bacterium]MCB9533792.1 cupin-like domain-containing protein [Myxococcales bacterium]